jgi:hypothetical protein
MKPPPQTTAAFWYQMGGPKMLNHPACIMPIAISAENSHQSTKKEHTASTAPDRNELGLEFIVADSILRPHTD